MSEERLKKPTLAPLDKQQVDYALEIIEELHPIAHTPLYVVYPALEPLQPCLGWVPGMRYPRQKAADQVEMQDLITGE